MNKNKMFNFLPPLLNEIESDSGKKKLKNL